MTRTIALLTNLLRVLLTLRYNSFDHGHVSNDVITQRLKWHLLKLLKILYIIAEKTVVPTQNGGTTMNTVG